MGMTINEHKEDLLNIMDSMPDDACGDWRNSLAYAVDIMNKYQKIEQLVKFYKNAGEIPIFVLEGIMKDGNDN